MEKMHINAFVNTTQKKQTTQNTAKQNYALYDTRPRNEVGLFYNAPQPILA